MSKMEILELRVVGHIGVGKIIAEDNFTAKEPR